MAMPIYGDDDRVPVSEAPEGLGQVFSAVAANISSALMTYDSSNNAYTLNEKLIGTLSTMVRGDEGPGRLCQGQRFGDYLNPSNCTGFLVGDDLLLTAGHCARRLDDCKRNFWVFDFKTSKGSNRGSFFIPSKNVYSCKEIVDSKVVTNYSTDVRIDYAIVRLDRKVEGRSPLKLRREGTLSCQDDLYVVGHPSGLPLTYSPNGRMSCLTQDQGVDWFNTNLDTFSGNSGSPVLNSSTGLVEGILVRGAEDYAYDPKRLCYVVVQQPRDSFREGVTRIKTVLEKLESVLSH